MKSYKFYFSPQCFIPDAKRLEHLLLLEYPNINAKLLIPIDEKLPYLFIKTSIIDIESIVKNMAAAIHLEIKMIICPPN